VLAPLATPGKEEKVRRRAQDTLLTHEAISGGEEEEELRASPSAADFEAPPKTGRSVCALCYRKPKRPFKFEDLREHPYDYQRLDDVGGGTIHTRDSHCIFF